MKYMVTWTIKPENIKAAIARFKETGGQPPAGAKLLGRWHVGGTGKGFALFEADDPVAITKAGIEWSDLLEQNAVAVVEDAELAAALQ